jgi:ribose transport system substrate-binding protein
MKRSKSRILAASLTIAAVGCGLAGIASTAAVASKAKKHYTIGASVLGTEYPAVDALDRGMQAEAKHLGVTLVLADSQGSSVKQASDIDDLIARHVNGLIVNAVDKDAVLTPVASALSSKIPVVAAYTTLGDATCVYPGTLAYEGFNETGWAHLAGEEALKLLPDGGNVAIIEGLPGLAATTIRLNEFVKTISVNPNIHIVAEQPGNYDLATSRAAMANILSANPNINLVYGADDNTALGAIQALQAAGQTVSPSGIKVIGLGGTKAGLASVKAGVMTATVFASLTIGGERAIKAIVDHLNGEKVKTPCDLVPYTLVTAANISKFINKGEY